MQTAVPEVMDVSKESDDIVKLYGPDCLVPGTFAANALLARKLSENGVRFVQLYHQGWDQHGDLPYEITKQAKDVDQASAALVTDLKQRGLLDETLVIWGGEFGRTNYSQGKLTKDNYGRDHHPRCFRSGWQEVALSRESFMGKRMSLDTMYRKILFMYMIFRQLCYINWGLIMRNWFSSIPVAGTD